jgi:3-keto steroid reductase
VQTGKPSIHQHEWKYDQRGNFVSGVGFGICQRLLLQLHQPNASDGFPQEIASNIQSKEKPIVGYQGVTLVMACRNMKRADAARTKLLRWLDTHLADLQKLPMYDKDYVRNFQANFKVHIHELDLASVSSVLKFGATIRKECVLTSYSP